MSKYILEIALTHDHFEGHRQPDYFQAMLVPIRDGQVDWSAMEPFTPPALTSIVEDIGLDGFLERVAAGLFEGEPERIEWSLEAPDDCAICPALAQAGACFTRQASVDWKGTMAKIRRRYYGPKTEEQRDPKYGRRAGAQTVDQRAYADKKAKKGKR